MEFKTNDNPWIIGFPIHESYSILEQKAFHLLSIINASAKSNSISDLKNFLVIEYEFSEISRLLLECAVQIRNEIDQKYILSEDNKYSINSFVGILFHDTKIAPEKSTNLTFREACNKIIHTKHINFDLENAKSINEYDSLNNTIYLYGDYQNKEWKVELDVCTFICVLINIK
ncbi:MAG: hypothetical protein M0R23_08995 [Bacteroidales bacterium]|jgi:hypothetical protein|nr:hypothetical protein [Bacteroidales bacterium]